MNINNSWLESAMNIHKVIYNIASTMPIRVGFNSQRAIVNSINELKDFGIKKPFFSNGKSWIRNKVVLDQDAYLCLAVNTRLEFIINGDLCYWRGYGDRIDYEGLVDFAEKAGMWVLEKHTPVWICMNFGFNYEPFIGLLEDLKEGGVSKV